MQQCNRLNYIQNDRAYKLSSIIIIITSGRRRYSATPPDLVPCSLLRSSSVSYFPAPSQLSSSMCSLVFLCLDNLEGSISELFSLYCCQLSSLCGNVCPIQVHFLRVNRCLHGILLSHVPQFFIGYLVFPSS